MTLSLCSADSWYFPPETHRHMNRNGKVYSSIRVGLNSLVNDNYIYPGRLLARTQGGKGNGEGREDIDGVSVTATGSSL